MAGPVPPASMILLDASRPKPVIAAGEFNAEPGNSITIRKRWLSHFDSRIPTGFASVFFVRNGCPHSKPEWWFMERRQMIAVLQDGGAVNHRNHVRTASPASWHGFHQQTSDILTGKKPGSSSIHGFWRRTFLLAGASPWSPWSPPSPIFKAPASFGHHPDPSGLFFAPDCGKLSQSDRRNSCRLGIWNFPHPRTPATPHTRFLFKHNQDFLPFKSAIKSAIKTGKSAIKTEKSNIETGKSNIESDIETGKRYYKNREQVQATIVNHPEWPGEQSQKVV